MFHRIPHEEKLLVLLILIYYICLFLVKNQRKCAEKFLSGGGENMDSVPILFHKHKPALWIWGTATFQLFIRVMKLFSFTAFHPQLVISSKPQHSWILKSDWSEGTCYVSLIHSSFESSILIGQLHSMASYLSITDQSNGLPHNWEQKNHLKSIFGLISLGTRTKCSQPVTVAK